MLVESLTLPTPTIDGKYRLEEIIGEGAHGTVYRAVHLGLKKPFALKLLHASAAGDPGLIGRFRREAEALGRLKHPAIVEVTDFGVESENGPPYLVMELLEGRPLSDLLRAEGPLPLARALPILEAVAGAVDAAHGAGILHRDLKPGNVLLEDDGVAAKVLDFGLAELAGGVPAPGFGSAHPSGYALDLSHNFGEPGATVAEPRALSGVEGPGVSDAEPRLTATGTLLGTPLYIAPELIAEPRASRASDLYSFGVLAYEMLAGATPFRGTTGEVLTAHLRREPPVPANLGAGLPAEAWEALRPALSKDPAERPASARQLVERLRAAGRAEEVRTWRKQEIPRRLGLAAFVALPLLLGGLLAVEPVWKPLEALAFDTNLRFAPAIPPDPRILIVTLDIPTPDTPLRPLASRGPEIAAASEAMLAAGARGLAFDFLPPAWWGQVEPIQDLLVRHADRLTLVAASTPTGTVEGSSFVSPLTLAQVGEARARAMFGFINIAVDGDGIIRRGRTWFRTTRGEVHPSWAARAAGLLTGRPPALPKASEGQAGDGLAAHFWIDFRLATGRYARLPIEEVASVAASRPGFFRDRLVLIGGDLQTPFEDRQRVPRAAGRSDTLPGLLVQALQVDTLARGRSIRAPGARPFALAAALLAFAAAATVLCTRRLAASLATITALALLAATVSFLLFQRLGILLPGTPVAAFWTFGALLPWGLRRFLPRVPMP